ncbi:class I SAM-dependent RNA methyltransferase [Geovibrio thiophilus]|uniref:Class I SAM-dependent RNA methyltransferase n=1 Tax=Geovibrio thiophilus TaxID=139438 RepID=A0A3R5UVI0_9BACT|nr:methyltransferase domain-containing protein [Geovibrio thiophilus]QAR33713.1 class I SAM-dependent RNA methyltransferase [Geovibrio thiophilus]
MRFETEIRDTAYGGYGIGTFTDGRTAFIPFAVEGDRVVAEMTEDKKSFIYANLVEVITPSAKRGEKYCPHIGICGGCSFGHIDYEAQKEIKVRIVRQAFRNVKCGVPSEAVSGEKLRYRNRVTFKVKGGKLGFYAFKSRDFIEVGDCPLVSETLVAKCSEFAAANVCDEIYELYAVENGKGGFLASVKGIESDDVKFVAFDGISGKDFVIGEEYMELDTPLGAVLIGGDSFLQSNRFLMGELQKKAVNAAGVNALELYCGSGFFTIGLADKFRSVTAVEISKEAIRLGQKLELANVRWVAGDVTKFIKTSKGRFDHVLADPPRTGLEKSVVGFIREKKPTTVTYVSCNPTTLARDVAKLQNMYDIKDFTIMDMFPGTHHVECVVCLALKS